MSEACNECKVEKKVKLVKKVIIKRVAKRNKEVDAEPVPVKEVKMESVSAPATEAPEVPEVNDVKENHICCPPDPIVLNIDSYVRDMDEMTRKAMEIARDHLESSFNLEKCCGYLSYIEGGR